MLVSRRLKIAALALGGVLALLVVASVSLLLFVDADAFRPRLEAAASETLGMEVEVGGASGISLLPRLALTLDEVYVRNRGTDLLYARQAKVAIGLWALLRDELQVRKVVLTNAVLSIERDSNGRFNYEYAGEAVQPVPALDLANVSISEGTLVYVDKESGKGFESRHCSIAISQLRHPGGARSELMKNLSATARVACRDFRQDGLAGSGLKLSAKGTHGVFDLEPMSIQIFGAEGSGSAKANFSGAVPVYEIHFSLPQFRIEDFFKTRLPKRVADGRMDFSTDLAMQGRTMLQMRQTAAGHFLLRGKDLKVIGRDLDREFDDFESSQTFNLVDVGAFFFAGPLGLAVTKGYNFANLLKESGGSSDIDVLVSDWTIKAGVAEAEDVALATKKNRLALHGRLDFVNQRFDHVVVALIDRKGCAKLRQKIRGTFDEPTIEQPGVLESLAGPAIGLLKKGADLVSSQDCNVFYAGTVAPPK